MLDTRLAFLSGRAPHLLRSRFADETLKSALPVWVMAAKGGDRSADS
jgi:hypothetical protein